MIISLCQNLDRINQKTASLKHEQQEIQAFTVYFSTLMDGALDAILKVQSGTPDLEVRLWFSWLADKFPVSRQIIVIRLKRVGLLRHPAG